MKKKILQIIIVFIFFEFSVKCINSRSHILLIKGMENCICCKERIKTVPHFFSIAKHFIHPITFEAQKNLKKIKKNSDGRNKKNSDVRNKKKRGDNFRTISEEADYIRNILKEADKWTDKLSSSQMEEFQRLWITDSLYPKGYKIILSKFFHDICFYKLRTKYLKVESKKLYGLVAIVSKEDLCKLMFSDPIEENKNEKMANYIMAPKSFSDLNDLMKTAESIEICGAGTRKRLKKMVSEDASVFIPPESFTPFIWYYNELRTNFIDKIINALKIVKKTGIIKNFQNEFDKSICNEIERLYLTEPMKKKTHLIIEYLFESNFVKLNSELIYILDNFKSGKTFAIIILIFDKFFMDYKNKMDKKDQNYQDLEKIIGNQSLFYVILSLLKLRPECKQILADYYCEIASQHGIVSISNFVHTFVLFPLGLTEITLLINFINHKKLNLGNYEEMLIGQERYLLHHYSKKELKYHIEKELDPVNFSNDTLEFLKYSKLFNCSPETPRVVARNNFLPANIQEPISGLETVHPPIQYAFNEEELGFLNDLKFITEFKESIIGLDQLLSSIEIETLFNLNDNDQTIMFTLLFSYNIIMNSFPKEHYKLCVMKLINMPFCVPDYFFDKMASWFDAILNEKKFIDWLPINMIADNIMFLYSNNISLPHGKDKNCSINFELFLRSNNVPSMNSFLSKVDSYINDNMSSWHQDETESFLIESLIAFKWTLYSKIINNAENTCTTTKTSNKRKKAQEEKQIAKKKSHLTIESSAG